MADLEAGADSASESFSVEENIGRNEEIGSTPRRRCPECLVRCHIRCNKCPSCHTLFPPSKKKLALGPPRKYPSNLFAQLHKKANQLHQVGYDVFILTHKSNPTLHTFQRIATPGEAVKFNIKYGKVYQLWKTYMSVKEQGESQGGAKLSEIGEDSRSDIPSRPAERSSDDVVSPDAEIEAINLPPQPTEHGSDDIVSPQPTEYGSDDVVLPGMEGAAVPSQSAERGSNDMVSPQPAELDSNDMVSPQPTERGSNDMVSPQPTERGSNDMVSPQPAERESPEVVGADLPSQPAECGSAHLQSSKVGDTERFDGSKQPVTSKGTQQCAENQDVSQTGKQSEGRKSRKRRRCGDCINCQKPKCQKCLPCQNPKWKKPCKERKCLQLLNI